MTLLPLPLSPTMQRVWPRRSEKRDVVDRLELGVAAEPEPGAQVLHFQHRRLGSGRFTGVGVSAARADRPRRAGRRRGN